MIGAIARDAPAALADLRPGAVVQAAAINALAELGYGPERAVGRATQIVAGEEAEPDLNSADDADAVARSVATAATQAPHIILANSGFFGELRRRLFGEPAETPSPSPSRADLERWQQRLRELAEPSTPEQRGDLAETFARIADGRLDVDDLPRDQDGRVRIGRYALDPRVAEYMQEILRTPPEGLRALAREIQSSDMPPLVRARLLQMIGDRLRDRGAFAQNADQAEELRDQAIRRIDHDIVGNEQPIIDGIGGIGGIVGRGQGRGNNQGPQRPSSPAGPSAQPPPTPTPTPSLPSAGVPRLTGNGERILRRFPSDRREMIRREFIETGRLGEIKRSTINVEVGGGVDAANRDFDRLVQLFGGSPAAARVRGAGVRTYEFPDGVTINVRPTSESGRPTVEVQSPGGYVARRY